MSTEQTKGTRPGSSHSLREGQGGLGPSILWLAPFNAIHYASNRASPRGKYCTGHSHRTVMWGSGARGRGPLWQDHQWRTGACQSPRGSTEQKGQFTSWGRAAGQIIKPLPAGWFLCGHGNYMVGKTPSSLRRETKRRGIHQRNAVKHQRFKTQLPYL